MYNPDLSTTARLEALEARVSVLEAVLQGASQPSSALDPSSPEDLWAWLRANRSATTLHAVVALQRADDALNDPELTLKQLQEHCYKLTRDQLRSGLAALVQDGLLRAVTSVGPYSQSQELYSLCYRLDPDELERDANQSVRPRASRTRLPFTPSF